MFDMRLAIFYVLGIRSVAHLSVVSLTAFLCAFRCATRVAESAVNRIHRDSFAICVILDVRNALSYGGGVRRKPSLPLIRL